ncbi:MAG: HAD family hydrolase [Acidimicrobiia bacterium]
MDDPWAGVEAVFLDVGGVFHLPAHQPILDAFRRAGVEADPDRLDRAHYAGVAALAVWPDEDDGVWDAYMEAYATEVGVGPERREQVMAELFTGFNTPGIWSRLVPGSLDALRALAATGLPLAIVSNSDGTLEERLAEEGICQVGPGRGVPMAVVIDSRAVGVAKPDPAIFDIALRATGVPAGAALHVGDATGADVLGALAAGVRPVHLDPYGFCIDDTHLHLQDLAELAPRLVAAARP